MIQQYNFVIPPFSITWWYGLIIPPIIIIFILFGANKLDQKWEHRLSVFLGILMLSRKVWQDYLYQNSGMWTLSENLPLHWCGLTSILGAVCLLHRHQLGFELLIMVGIPGAIHGILTPQATVGNNLLLIEYYSSHSGIILASLYLHYIKRMKIRKSSWFFCIIIGQVSLVIVGIINYFLDTNYIFLCEKPAVNNPFLLGEWPFYIFFVQLAAIAHIIFFYYLFYNKEMNN